MRWTDALVMLVVIVAVMLLWMFGIPLGIFWWAGRKGRQE